MNHYEKIQVVGRGAHGTVYLCRRLNDESCGQKVIVKQIPVDGMNLQERQNALGEVKVLQMLSHPNIIGYYDNFLDDNTLCIVMEYAEGGTICDMLQQRKGCLMDEDKIMFYFCQIVISLHHLHSKQILHRDLKSQNILMNKSRKVCKLSDFGISKRLHSKSRASTVIGTPQYLSPEICEGRPYNQKSDIWSLGCILYELITLKRAFDAETLPAVIMKITKGRFPPVADHVSEHVKSLLGELLNLDESKRPDTYDLLCHPLVVGPVLRHHTDMGTLPCPKVIKGSLTPTSSHRLKTRNDSRGQMSPRSLTGGHETKIFYWGTGVKSPMKLKLPSSNLEVKQVSCNGYQKMAVTNQGRLLIWEESEEADSDDMENDQPDPILSARYFKSPAPMSIGKVACGDLFTIYITDQGMLLSSGSGLNGCLGHGNRNDSTTPQIVEKLIASSVVQVSCGPNHVMAVTSDNKLYSWGLPDNGRLGLEGKEPICVPTLVDLPADLRLQSVYCSLDASAVLTTNGTVMVTGSNSHNKLGLSVSNVENENEVKWVGKFTEAKALPPVDLLQPQPYSLGTNHSALVSNGTLFTVGAPMGVGQPLESTLPRPVSIPSDMTPRRVVCGDNFTVIVTSDQSIFTFGKNIMGKLGREGVGSELAPVQLPNCEFRREITDLHVFDGSTVVFDDASAVAITRRIHHEVQNNESPQTDGIPPPLIVIAQMRLLAVK